MQVKFGVKSMTGKQFEETEHSKCLYLGKELRCKSVYIFLSPVTFF